MATMTGFMLMTTKGFNATPTQFAQERMIAVALKTLKAPEPDFLVFDPEHNGHPKLEDEGRTIHMGSFGTPVKCYAKLDDFGSPEALSESVGHKVGMQTVITLMLAEEY